MKTARGVTAAICAEVYELKALRLPAVPPRPERDAANLLNALHYIRQTAFAVQFSEVEYPMVVALQQY